MHKTFITILGTAIVVFGVLNNSNAQERCKVRFYNDSTADLEINAAERPESDPGLVVSPGQNTGIEEAKGKSLRIKLNGEVAGEVAIPLTAKVNPDLDNDLPMFEIFARTIEYRNQSGQSLEIFQDFDHAEMQNSGKPWTDSTRFTRIENGQSAPFTLHIARHWDGDENDLGPVWTFENRLHVRQGDQYIGEYSPWAEGQPGFHDPGAADADFTFTSPKTRCAVIVVNQAEQELECGITVPSGGKNVFNPMSSDSFSIVLGGAPIGDLTLPSANEMAVDPEEFQKSGLGGELRPLIKLCVKKIEFHNLFDQPIQLFYEFDQDAMNSNGRPWNPSTQFKEVLVGDSTSINLYVAKYKSLENGQLVYKTASLRNLYVKRGTEYIGKYNPWSEDEPGFDNPFTAHANAFFNGTKIAGRHFVPGRGQVSLTGHNKTGQEVLLVPLEEGEKNGRTVWFENVDEASLWPAGAEGALYKSAGQRYRVKVGDAIAGDIQVPAVDSLQPSNPDRPLERPTVDFWVQPVEVHNHCLNKLEVFQSFDEASFQITGKPWTRDMSFEYIPARQSKTFYSVSICYQTRYKRPNGRPIEQFDSLSKLYFKEGTDFRGDFSPWELGRSGFNGDAARPGGSVGPSNVFVTDDDILAEGDMVVISHPDDENQRMYVEQNGQLYYGESWQWDNDTQWVVACDKQSDGLGLRTSKNGKNYYLVSNGSEHSVRSFPTDPNSGTLTPDCIWQLSNPRNARGIEMQSKSHPGVFVAFTGSEKQNPPKSVSGQPALSNSKQLIIRRASFGAYTSFHHWASIDQDTTAINQTNVLTASAAETESFVGTPATANDAAAKRGYNVLKMHPYDLADRGIGLTDATIFRGFNSSKTNQYYVLEGNRIPVDQKASVVNKTVVQKNSNTYFGASEQMSGYSVNVDVSGAAKGVELGASGNYSETRKKNKSNRSVSSVNWAGQSKFWLSPIKSRMKLDTEFLESLNAIDLEQPPADVYRHFMENIFDKWGTHYSAHTLFGALSVEEMVMEMEALSESFEKSYGGSASAGGGKKDESGNLKTGGKAKVGIQFNDSNSQTVETESSSSMFTQMGGSGTSTENSQVGQPSDYAPIKVVLRPLDEIIRPELVDPDVDPQFATQEFANKMDRIRMIMPRQLENYIYQKGKRIKGGNTKPQVYEVTFNKITIKNPYDNGQEGGIPDLTGEVKMQVYKGTQLVKEMTVWKIDLEDGDEVETVTLDSTNDARTGDDKKYTMVFSVNPRLKTERSGKFLEFKPEYDLDKYFVRVLIPEIKEWDTFGEWSSMKNYSVDFPMAEMVSETTLVETKEKEMKKREGVGTFAPTIAVKRLEYSLSPPENILPPLPYSIRK